MKAEIYLSRGEREGVFKAELYLDGSKPTETITAQFTREQFITLAGNFYKNLVFGGVEEELTVEVKNKGIEQRVYEEINNQVRNRLEELKINRNMN